MSVISFPQKLIVGSHTLEKIHETLELLDLSYPLIITDKVMLNLGYVDSLIKSLNCPNYGIFSETEQEPSSNSISNAVSFFKKNSDYDCLIAIGGGSVIDSAKIISLLALNGGEVRDYKVPYIVKEPVYPVIAIPTTAGTGSEVTAVSVISDSISNEKMLLMGPSFMPKTVILDHTLTLSMPSRVTADTGLDAMTHAIEAYISKKSNSFTNAMALSAISLLAPNIETVFNNPDNLNARESMMLGSTLAGIAFSNSSVGLVHGMSRPLGVFFKIPHGMSNAMLLPIILKKLRDKNTDEKYDSLFDAMKLNINHGECKAVSFVDYMSHLCKSLRVPSLNEFGVCKETYFSKLEIMASQAIQSGSPQNSPKILDEDEIISLYKELWNLSTVNSSRNNNELSFA